ncbi:MAG: division plane positioning ATPase MipZ [Cycloclasticus sp.]|jgi:chromosome partitioning protein|nr:MAG: ATPase [Cycloclasticus sp. Phe_18]MBV1913392.1 division plane positioning ATPase MipZ [Cycloclasticus sp.]MDF1689542.1 division plane positioning ATPase MipZ [Cycloclasticus sp.]MEE4290770.1 division plane positioning ATPase MipZ [Cycloclasticus sp.]
MDKKDAHIIVLGNEKGGTGKSTLAMHIIVGLLDKGKKVAVIDLDARQKSVARYVQNRQTFMANGGAKVAMPEFKVIAQSTASLIKDREIEDQQNFQKGLDAFKKDVDFIVIDCPGNDTYLSRLAHALADTLVTPLNDSFVDLDLLGEVSPTNFQVKKLSFYTEMVWDSRKYRSASGKPPMDWVVVRTRLASLDSRNNKRVHDALDSLQKRIMFRYVPGLYERVIYKELFPSGLTILDLEKVNSMSHVAARQEVRSLIGNLNLFE